MMPRALQDCSLDDILPIDIISTNTSSWISSAAKAAHMPEVRVAIAGVPVAGQTWLRVLREQNGVVNWPD